MSDCLRFKKSNCKNCYKCIRHCPVKSIRFSAGQANIIGDECILCGHCFVVCPQNAKDIADDTEKVRIMLQGEDPVIASLAPSFIADYDGAGIESMREALMKLGFSDVQETALGATLVKREYDRMLREDRPDVLISSCCHSINLLIQKYFPSLLPYLADVVTPMKAHCMEIKRKNPKAKTVFIGPCVAKKDEAQQSGGVVDAVLTFEELSSLLEKDNIEIRKEIIPQEKSLTRLFPTVGGIIKSMTKDAPGYRYLAIDGVENCMVALRDIENGNLKNCFIEMSACTGGCIGGPVMKKYHRSPVRDYLSVADFAGREDFDISQPEITLMKDVYVPLVKPSEMPSEYEITRILREMGKFRPSDELNCGSCGYNTCREKAIAIYQGKAEVSMCLVFLKEKAEGFSNAIVENSPNAIIVLNDSLEVQQINKSAMNLMHIRSQSEILGDYVVRILDPKPFMQVLQTKRAIDRKRVYLAEYGCCVEQTVVLAEEGRMLVCIMRDVTDEEDEKRRKEEISKETMKVADEVVDKQMRIVQEIAYLLGETAAETKVALSKLKESIKDE